MESVLALDIGPDAEEEVVGLLDHVDGVLALVISSVVASLILHLLLNLFLGHLGVNINVLKDVSTDLIELAQLNVSQLVSVITTP
jgi:hypothetical protein